MAWAEYTSCDGADFSVRSIPDGHQTFGVKRAALEQGSSVFRAYLIPVSLLSLHFPCLFSHDKTLHWLAMKEGTLSGVHVGVR